MVADIPNSSFAGKAPVHWPSSMTLCSRRRSAPQITLDQPKRPSGDTLAGAFGFRSLQSWTRKLTLIFKLETGRRTMASKSKTNRRDLKVTTT
jgi:hypothetical protein